MDFTIDKMSVENQIISEQFITTRLNALTKKVESTFHFKMESLKHFFDGVDAHLKRFRQDVNESLQLSLISFQSYLNYERFLENVGTNSVEECLSNIEQFFCSKDWLTVTTNPQLLGSIRDSVSIKADLSPFQNIVSHMMINSKDSIKCRGEGMSNDPFLVTLCHVVNPSEFYVHRQCDKLMYETLCEQLKSLDETEEFSGDINSHTVYAVYLQERKVWRRGREAKLCGFQLADGPVKSLYEFFLVDEGWYERVPSNCVRNLPESLACFPTMAIPCQMHQLYPNHVWSSKAIHMFKSLTKLRVLDMKVFAEEGGILSVDLSQLCLSIDEPCIVSVRDAMLFLNLGHLKCPSEVNCDREYKVKLPGIGPGTCLSGTVVDVVSPFKFYLQIPDSDIQQLWQLQHELQQQFTAPNAEYTLTVSTPQKGLPYGALYRDDGQWYRGLAEDIFDDGQVQIFFVDYGNRQKMHPSNLRRLHERFLQLPAQAVCCKLDGIRCVERERRRSKKTFWSHASCDVMREKLVDKEVAVFVESVASGSVGKAKFKERLLAVTLYIKNGEKSINSALSEAGFSVSWKRHEQPWHSRQLNPSVLSSCHDLNTNRDESGVEETIINHVQDHQFQSVMNSVEISDNDNLNSEMRNITPSSKEAKRDRKVEQVSAAETLDNFPSSDVEGKHGEFAHGEHSGNLIRSLVENSPSSCGAEEYSELQLDVIGTPPTNEEYQLLVKFVGCTSLDGVYFRPEDFQQRYEELRQSLGQTYQSVNLKRAKNFDIGFVGCTLINNEWHRCAVIDMCEKSICCVECIDTGAKITVDSRNIFPLIEPFDLLPSLVIRCSLHGVTLPQYSSEDEVIEEIKNRLGRANQIGIVKRSKLKVDRTPLPVMVFYKYWSDGGPLELPGEKIVNLNDQLIAEKLVGAKQKEDGLIHWTSLRVPATWLPATQMNIQKQFVAEITWVDLNANIYMFDVKKSENTLNYMKDTLNNIFSDTKPSEADLICHPGEICIARYELDGCWYRANIEAVGEKINKVAVHFVDYGTNDYVDCSNIRKDIHLSSIPIQTLKCSLHNLKPPNAPLDAQWPVETLNYLHRLVVDNRCQVEVKISSPLQVALILPNGENVAEHLIQRGLAELIENC